MKIFKKKIRNPLKKKKKDIPNNLGSKCPKCGEFIFNVILDENLKICNKCDFHFPLNCWERVELLADTDSFVEMFENIESKDPLNFKGAKTYKQKLEEAKKKTNLKSAAIVGTAEINGKKVALGITDQRFIMGSMGSAVGEKITLIAEHALKEKIPLVIVSGSGGGARMYEGMLSLMQMAKTSAALAKLKKAGVPYISLLTHPTMGGVMASFAGLGDIMIAEPHALVGFAGPRVIKQTIKQDLPKEFQTSEFSLKHGLVDMVVHRDELKDTIYKVINYLT